MLILNAPLELRNDTLELKNNPLERNSKPRQLKNGPQQLRNDCCKTAIRADKIFLPKMLCPFGRMCVVLRNV